MKWAALALTGVVAAGCEPTVPVRGCAGCTYDFADTIPPDTSLVFHWPAARLPVRYYADSRAAMPALVATGIATWNAQFLYGEFRAVQVADSTAADVIVQWEAAPPPDVPPDTSTVDACAGSTTNPSVVFRDSSARVLHVTLGVKAGAFTDAQVAGCLRRVAIHELGHSLGLLKHSLSRFDIMNVVPTVSFSSVTDRRTVELLYHTPPTVLPPP